MITVLQNNFSFKSFATGLTGVVVIFGALFGYAALQSSKTIVILEERLASEIVIVKGVFENEPLASSDSTPRPENEVVVEHQLSPKDSMPAPQGDENTDIKDIIGSGAKALAPVPLTGLYEETPEGLLPIINKASKNTPFEAYRKPALINRDTPTLAVAIIDYGLSEIVSQSAIAMLPSSVSFILSPYADDPEAWQKAARADGHEFWMHMIAQTQAFPQSDPGPNAFLSNVSFRYNRDRLHWLLTRSAGYAGLAGYTDNTLSEGGAMFKNLINEVFNRGLGFFELNTEIPVFVKGIAADTQSPYANASMVVKDLSADSQTRADVEQKLNAYGAAVIVVKPTLKNLEDLKNWLRALERNNVQIVPVSAIAALNAEG